MNDRGGGLGSALKGIGKAALSFGKGAGKSVWKGIVTGAKFYGKHSKTINQAVDMGIDLGGALGLFDEDTMETINEMKGLASAFLKEKGDPKAKTGKGRLRGYL